MTSKDFGVDLSVKDTFSFKRMGTVAGRVLRQITRDKRTLGMLMIMPIVVMVVFGVALTGEIENIPIVVINDDVSVVIPNPIVPNTSITINAGDLITDGLKTDSRVDVDSSVSNWEKAKTMVEDGKVNAVILIPHDFSAKLAEKLNDSSVIIQLSIHIDATKPSIRASIIGALQGSLQDSLGAQSVEFDQSLAFGNAEFSGFDVAIPAVMALVLAFLVLLISLVTIVRDQLYGTQARMYSTPLTKIERLLGFVIALSVIGVLMVISVTVIGILIFGAVVKGNFGLLLLSAYLYTLVHVLMAVLLSSFAQNELQAVQFAPLISFPGMAISGMMTPVNALPPFAQVLSYFIPMTYGVNIFEGVMLKGMNLLDLWVNFAALLGFGVIFFILAFLTVKDKID